MEEGEEEGGEKAEEWEEEKEEEGKGEWLTGRPARAKTTGEPHTPPSRDVPPRVRVCMCGSVATRVCVSVCVRCIRVWRRHAKLCPLVLRTPGITPIGFLSCSQLTRWLLWILWMPWMPMDSWMLPSSLRHAYGSYGSHGCLWIPEDSPGFLTVFLCISFDSYGKAKEQRVFFWIRWDSSLFP